MKNIKEIESKVEDLRIFETIGEASMCWKPIPSGVFNSELALKIGHKLEQKIKLLLTSSLTSLLEGLKESLPPEREIKVDNFGVEYPYNKEANAYRQEVIKIIDSLK